MTFKKSLLILLGAVVLGLNACSAFAPTPTPTPLPTATAYPTFTPQPTFTPEPTQTPLPTFTPVPTDTPTLTPTSTPTPIPPTRTPTAVPLPKAGLWQGSNLSFRVTEDGSVRDFRATATNFALSCTYTLKGPLEIVAQQFEYVEKGQVETASFKGFATTFQIKGTFDSTTTATVTFAISVCENTFIIKPDGSGLVPITGEWNAEWQNENSSAN